MILINAKLSFVFTTKLFRYGLLVILINAKRLFADYSEGNGYGLLVILINAKRASRTESTKEDTDSW